MKKIYYICVIALATMMFSCANEENGTGDAKKKFGVTSDDFVFVDGEGTRSEVYLDGGIVKFRWTDGDQMNVYAYKDGTIDLGVTNFNIFGSTGNDAKFDGQGFALDPEYSYYSFGKYDANALDLKDIQMTYAGQRMHENNSLEDLGPYDYQGSYGTGIAEHAAFFWYKHLGAVVRFVFQDVPKDKKFNKFTIQKADGSDINYIRYVNLLDGGDAGEAYNPVLFTKDADPVVTKFEVALGPDNESGISPDASGNMTVYMMMPGADDFKDKAWYAQLTETGQEEPSYYMSLPGRDMFYGGKAYSYTRKAIPTSDLSITISVDKDWKIGNTQTRAGDPGINEVLEFPTNVIIYTCIDNKVYNTTHLNNLTKDSWAENGNVLNLKQSVNIKYNEADNINVYAYAYTSNAADFTVASSVTDGTTTEADLQNLAFSSNDQPTLKNLYSTAYTTTPAYQGTVNMQNTPKVVGLTLYHVAAKMDVQWHSDVALNGNIRTNDVPGSGLLLFKPTENTSTSDLWTPSVALNPGTQFLGRQVFYIPQLQSQAYSITLGGTDCSQTFTAPTTNGWTSWFKLNITPAQ